MAIESPEPEDFSNPPLPSSVLLSSDRGYPILSSPTQSERPRGDILNSRTMQAASERTQATNARVPQPQTRASVPSRGEFSGMKSVQSRARPIGSPQDTTMPLPRFHNGPQNVPNSAPAANPHKRQRTQPTGISLNNKIDLIDQHLESVGGEQSLNMALERPRFQLLREACGSEDIFYVALHQLFLVWDTNREEVLSIQGFPDPRVLSDAFKVVASLIKGNGALAPIHKTWFAKFPGPLSNLLTVSGLYRQTITQVGAFLWKLTHSWAAMKAERARRGYPVLLDELVNRLGLVSPILQGVVFTASRRDIGILDGPAALLMEDLFKKDQHGHQRLAQGYGTDRPPTAKEVEERNKALIAEYSNVYQQFIQQQQRRASSSAPTQTSLNPLQSNGQSIARAHNGPSPNQIMMPRPQQGAQQQQTWSENMPSLDIAGNWQFSAQQPHTSRCSPNPSIIAGRPASVASANTHANTPSPTLFQGLSMHSPVQQNFQFGPVLRSNIGPLQPHGQHSNAPAQNGMLQHSPVLGSNQFQQAPYIPQQQQQQLAGQQHQNYAAQAAQQQQHIVAQQHMVQQQQNLAAQAARHQQMLTSQSQHQQHRAAQYQQIPVLFSSPLQQQYVVAHVQQNIHALQQNQQVNHLQQRAQVQQATQQQVLDMNRAAQLRRDNSIPNGQQRVHSRTGSPNSNPRTPSAFVQAPRPLGSTPDLPRYPVDQGKEDIQAYLATNPSQRRLVPPLGFQHHPQVVAHGPEITALHQALLRSPRLSASEFVSTDKTQNDPDFRYYQAIRSFAVPPTKLTGSPIAKFEFNIPHADLIQIPKDTVASHGQTPVREFTRRTLQYRVRCINMRHPEAKCSRSEWMVADTSWPESACLEMNGKQLQIRLKSHHTKDLPIDITQLVRVHGSNYPNKVTLSMIRGRNKLRESSYFFGVDVTEILGHQQIIDMCQRQRIPADVTLNKIKMSLAPPEDDDDDFAMALGDISIDLADPFMSRIFDIPVRGANCLHRECFDLQTFLLTRQSKPKRPQQPAMPDQWKCPLCGADARPSFLQIDGFLEDVRAALAQDGHLDCRAIWVDSEGRWRPKVEKRKATGEPDANDSDYSSDGDGAILRRAKEKQQQAQTQRPPPDVIILDD